jgi:multicomponent Na+:H+ antiporter subunit G
MAAHLVGRAAYDTEHLHPELLIVDELRDRRAVD